METNFNSPHGVTVSDINGREEVDEELEEDEADRKRELDYDPTN